MTATLTLTLDEVGILLRALKLLRRSQGMVEPCPILAVINRIKEVARAEPPADKPAGKASVGSGV